MNENKRLIIAVAVIVIVIGLIFAISFWPKPDKSFVCGMKADGNYEKLASANYNQYKCLIKEDGKNAVVIAGNMTDEKKKALNEAAKSIGHSIYYLNTKKISKDEMNAIKKQLKYKKSPFKKDVILVIKDGKVETYKEKINSKDDVKAFLNEANLAKFACDVTPNEEYENLGMVTIDQYKCLLESEKPFALVVSQTTCGYCKAFKPIINEYVGKNNIPLYVIEINELSDSDRQEFLSSLSYFEENQSWGTPLTLGIENKEVVTQIGGFTEDESEYDNFFETMKLK